MSESTDPISTGQVARRAIAAEAVKHLNAHYIRGGGGATPGKKDGVWYRPGQIEWAKAELDKPGAATYRAASCVITELHVCSGRYNALPGGRPFAATDSDLLRYLTEARELRCIGVQERSWPSWPGFTPRRANWKTPSGITTQCVWGEDCTGIRHFDCIGFVAFVLEKAVGRKLAVHREISDYFTATKARDKANPWPGDIATIDGHHIGIIFDKDWVVSATDGARCVLKEKYDPNKWTRVGRFTDDQLQA